MSRRNLVVLGSIEIDPKTLVLSAGETKTFIQVAKCGLSFKKGARQFDITESMLDNIVENAEKLHTQIPLDYNHLSLGAVLPDQAVAAGWFDKLERREKELWGLTEFTPKAIERIQNKEFRYISPVIDPLALDEHGKGIGARLISAALTNYPFLKNMAPVELSELQRAGIVLADLSIDQARSRLSSALSEKYAGDFEYVYLVDVFESEKYVVYMRGGKYYRLSYAVDDDWTVKFEGEPKEVVPQYTLLSEDNPMPDPKNTPITGQEELKAQVDALSAKVTSLSEDLTKEKTRSVELEKTLKTRDANAAVDALVSQAKIKKEDRDVWVELHMDNPDRFLKLSASLVPAVKLRQAHGTDAGPKEPEEPADPNAIPGEPEKVIALMESKINEYIKEHGGPEKCKAGEAMKAVSAANPDLTIAYRNAFVL